MKVHLKHDIYGSGRLISLTKEWAFVEVENKIIRISPYDIFINKGRFITSERKHGHNLPPGR